MKSMTGYSKLNFEDDNFKIKIEIKSVNKKYSNLNLKIPYILNFMENKIRTLIFNHIKRGNVDLRLDIEDKRESENLLSYDKNLAKNYINILSEIEKEFSENIGSKISYLLKYPNIIKKNEEEINEDEYSEIIYSKLDATLKNLNKMREEEGKQLEQYIMSCLFKIEGILNEIKTFKDNVVIEHKEKLLNRLNQIEDNIKYDEKDLLKEVMIFADRSDISEEISRFESHIMQFKKVIKEEENGKKLDFIIQEMFREANTSGVKSNYFEISKRIVEIKNELEKIREQVQNVE